MKGWPVSFAPAALFFLSCSADPALDDGVLAYPCGMVRAYDVIAIERKWQRHWEEEGTYQIDNDDPREKF